MDRIKDKKPVVINISLAQARTEKYAFYTPAFIVEDDVIEQRSVQVESLKDLIEAGYATDSSAYIYCSLAFAQEQRVESVVIINKKSNESYLEAYKDSPTSKFYFLSLESNNVDDVLSISDYLLATETYKLLFITKYEDVSVQLQGRRNIVWWWGSDFWFWDSSAIVVWDSNLDMELSIKHFPESAWISRCGSLFPSHVQWSCKELIGVSTQDSFSPQEGVDYDLSGHTQAPFDTPTNYYDNVMEYNVTWGDGTTCSGEWIDSVVFDDWLKWAIQRNIWKLFKSSPKINATDGGVELIKTKIKEVLDFAVEQDGILTYKITDVKYDRITRSSSFKFNYTRVHAIIGVISIDGVINA